jgi:hypothetical protein
MDIEKLKTIIESIEDGRYVNRKILFKVLGNDLLEIDRLWAEEKLYWSNKPKKIVEYSRLIRRGLINYSYGNKHSLKGDHYKSIKSFHKAESIFEKAVEYLYEAIEYDSNLRLWIDRDLSKPDEIDYCPGGIPKPIWYKGVNKKSIIQKTTKKQLILWKLQEKLDQLENKDQFELLSFNYRLKTNTKKHDFSGIRV